MLLLEAGGRNDDDSQRIDGKRWTTFMGEKMNWGYQTTPQEHCGGRQINYSRGKGLGGSSAINFGVYAVGARDDYDQWAAEVADDTFSWEQMQRRFKDLETFTGDVHIAEHRKFARPNSSDHGHAGRLRVGYAKEWDEDLPLVLDALEQAGLPRNLDHNSGNPLGMGLVINSVSKGRRTTGADLLVGVPDNLVIVTDSPAQRVLLEGKKAVGVETNGKKCEFLSTPARHLLMKVDMATKEVILSAGSLDTPKILMHSGIGPAKELHKFNIPLIHDLPAIGQGLRDHFFAPLIVTRNPSTNDRTTFYGNEATMAAAQTQWEKDNTGPWTKYGCQIGAGWFKSDRITSSAEFNALPDSVREFMNRETVPHWELITGFPAHFMFPDLFQDYSYTCFTVFLMNEQSTGEVRLQSSNPDVPLLFNPRVLEHPFDRRACIEMYRHLLEVARHPAFAKDTIATILGPKSDSDEDILRFWKETLSSTWHMTGTVKMGKPGSPDAAVDSRFRVFGMESLRVADMSVVPVLTNNHTQATAYVTGVTCADVLIEEYGLEQVTASF